MATLLKPDFDYQHLRTKLPSAGQLKKKDCSISKSEHKSMSQKKNMGVS